jgi:hypothetical protein
MRASLFGSGRRTNHPNRTISLVSRAGTVATTKGETVKFLIAALAAIAAAAVGVFLWRRNPGGVWTQATDATSSFGKTAADKVASTATAAADEIKGAVTS